MKDGSGSWAALLDALPHAAWAAALGEGGRVVAANAAAARLFGRPAAALLGQPAETLATSPEDLAWWAAAAAGEAPALHSDTVVAAADGRLLQVSRSIGPLTEDGRPTHAIVVLCDRSTEQQALADGAALLAQLQATLEATADGILVTGPNGRVHAFNRRFAEIWGLPVALLQEGDEAAVHEWMQHAVDADAGAYAERLHALRGAAALAASDRLVLRNGRVLDRVTRPLLRQGEPHGRVWSFRDLTERIAAEDRAEALVLCDALTGLANRRALAERVAATAAAARRDGGSCALLVVDLDRFRQINHSLGHDVGDRVLLEVAQRIQGCLRADDFLARVGGDQFAVLVHPGGAAAAEATARRVLNVVAQPCHIEGASFTLTCSIGVALAPSQGGGLDDLARHAEAAMRAVKTAGRANFRLHQARAEGDRRGHMRLDHAMRQALVSGRFRLHYQPQVEIASGRIVGAEALLRWRDPELGDVPPSTFIPVAEDSGFIVAIGDWVLSQAVRQAALWLARGHLLPIAVNVSALQFQQGHFVDRVASVLAVSGVPPQLLELELTESILVLDADEALHRLHALARLGVRLSIDDFGTGYSSLSYLKRFPIEKLKIDRSFVAGLPSDESDAAIVRAIVQMARALGMKVIAEGVETEAQRRFLDEAGCEQYQGWLCAKALDALSFEQRLAEAATGSPPKTPDKRMRLVRG